MVTKIVNQNLRSAARSKIVRVISMFFGLLLLFATCFYLVDQYMLSRVDCSQVTQVGKGLLSKKDYKDAYDHMSAKKRACSKDVGEYKTDKEKTEAIRYESTLAQSAYMAGDIDIAGEHIRKSIDNLRSIDNPAALTKDGKNINGALTIEQIFELDYQTHKNKDGSYDGYNR